jgi:uncharacterized protein (TIGR02246 family)
MATTGTVREDIEQRNRAFEAAFNSGDMAALAGAYAEDATVLPPDSEPVRGRHAIQQFWQGARDAGIQTVALHTVQVDAEGDVAAEIGTADLTVQAAGQASTVGVKYVVVWKRRAGGPWELAIDIWNSRPQ